MNACCSNWVGYFLATCLFRSFVRSFHSFGDVSSSTTIFSLCIHFILILLRAARFFDPSIRQSNCIATSLYNQQEWEKKTRKAFSLYNECVVLYIHTYRVHTHFLHSFRAHKNLKLVNGEKLPKLNKWKRIAFYR